MIRHEKTEKYVMKTRVLHGVTGLPVKSSAAGRLPANQPASQSEPTTETNLPDYKLLSF